MIPTVTKAIIHVTPGAEKPFNVKILTSVDGGKTFWYAGVGKYFKALDDAADFAAANTTSAR